MTNLQIIWNPDPVIFNIGGPVVLRWYGLFWSMCFLIFTLRFFIEFLKERQVDFEESMTLDMGQILSIHFIIIGGYFVVRNFMINNYVKL